jgi:type I restriction enzyme S subunit
MPIIRIQNVDSVRESDFVYWDGPFDDRFVVRNGDLLLTLSGSFRVVVWEGPEALLNQRIVKLIPKNGYRRDWLLYVLRNALNAISGMGRHALVSNVALADLRALKIPSQTIEEQRRIAAILDQAETLRTQRRTALALLDSLTQSLFLDMFGDPATNSRKWPVKRLKDLGQVITGGTPPSSKEGMFDGPIPFITPGDLESEEPVRRSVTEAGAKEVNVVRAGATLVCCIGATIGKVGIAQKDSAFNQQLNAVVWGNHISDNYGYEVMRFFKPTIISWGASTTLPILKKSSFEQIEIPVPPVPLQELFTDRLKHISNLKGLHKSALLGFDNLFNALQSRAFAGEP